MEPQCWGLGDSGWVWDLGWTRLPSQQATRCGASCTDTTGIVLLPGPGLDVPVFCRNSEQAAKGP